jgi:hypothetical protein
MQVEGFLIRRGSNTTKALIGRQSIVLGETNSGGQVTLSDNLKVELGNGAVEPLNTVIKDLTKNLSFEQIELNTLYDQVSDI